MKTVCAKDMCAGCMACINMCKKSAITIVDDYKTYNAVIDEVKCVNCGLCEKICPNVKCVEQVNPIFWKEGWALNPEIMHLQEELLHQLYIHLLKMVDMLLRVCLIRENLFLN